MDALMAALVAALVVEATDRTPWLIAIFADRFARRGVVIVASLCALATGFAIVALGGALIGERLTPEARQLFLAVALLNAGVSAFFPIKPPNRLDGWRVGAAATSFFGVFILAFGGRTQFIVMALAERGPLPALAAIGATLGSVAVVVLAALTGEAARRLLPITGLRIVSGIALSTIGTILALGALRLI
ncbi:TMEM165/GDT1 family protein [Sphingomonas sp. AR_OL41]|uniref:TMEM165/GDT1 family protein n=1 Tax=Sphingomonas sp. AR_OL41 TaxID=3042729 RepID=UPI002480586F|nr:TMEM165/GDT1 family protein [Sphingomonas sp. AR_OL41]MDH7973983.1 TMEM165/GDT1 family protein [Sphingomonas sp. AR_OL41]